MSKKQLRSRLENLFSNIGENGASQPAPQETEPSTPDSTTVRGWTWECDTAGTYLKCSAEVQEILGIPAGGFIGQSLFNFKLHSSSAAFLKNALAERPPRPGIPLEVDLFFQSETAGWLAVRIHILIRRDEHNNTVGWHGFTQLLPPELHPTPETLISETVMPPRIGTGPLRPWGPPSGSQTYSLVGMAYENETPRPASHVWTEAGMKSLVKNESIVQAAQATVPAAIAVPFEVRQQGLGVLEIVDETTTRQWSVDDRMLVEEVTKQLALALENAQLYAAVQQELGDRIRAEQETLRRNQDLAALNQIGQKLSHIATRDEIYELLYTTIGQILDTDNLVIAEYDLKRQKINFPLVIQRGNSIHLPTQSLKGVPENILHARTPLLIPSQVKAALQKMGISLGEEEEPASLLAVPMFAGERPVGMIILQEYQPERTYSNIQTELLSTIAAQASTAIENADLFKQMQNALAAIENRERYQANVARAVATLTESGTRALPEVLEMISQATQNSHIYFAQVQEDESGLYWRSIADWRAPDSAWSDKGKTQHMPVALFSFWANELREKGWIIQHVNESATPQKEFLTDQGVQTTLMLAVPGKTSTPSFLAFDQTGNKRIWQSEEIGVLRLAADAIANTFTREDLLDQLQATLDETEGLYNASHKLALAADQQEMVAAVATGLRSSSINQALLLLFEHDQHNKISRIVVSANWYSGYGIPPFPLGTELPVSIYGRTVATPTPLFYDEISEAQIEASFHDELNRQNIHSCAILPMWIGKRQSGALLLYSAERHHFTGREIRSYPPLVDQLATSIENQRLFEQTQAALSETAQLYKISNGIAQSVDAQELITLVAETLLPANADRASLLSVISNNEGEPTELEVIGFYDAQAEYQRSGIRLPIAALPIIKNLGNDVLIIPDIYQAGVDPISRKALQQFNIISTCMVPLRSAGRLIGIMTTSARRPAEYTAEEARLLLAAGNGLAVALERQRLLTEAQRRALELQTAAEIARDTTGTLSLDVLFSRIVALLVERFNFYHASIFLLDENGTYAVVRESTGDAGYDMKQRNHKLAVGSKSVIGMVTATGRPLVVNDVSQNAMYYPNPLLPDTKAEMGLPLKLGERVIGAVDIQSNRTNAFTADDLSVLQILADQIAVAIENARSYEISQRAFEEMREADRVKSQFLANMSHELRTPLNSIIGFSRVILKGIDGPVSDLQKQDLTAIYNSGQHLLNLINDILDLSKIEAGKMELAFSDVNLSDLVNSVMSTAIGLVKDKPIRLNQIVPADLPTVRADSTRVRQVLLNLISNASKFTEEGTITVEAAIQKSAEGKPEIIVTVTDSGPGIAEKDQVKLFQAFSQVDDSPTRKTGGTGLGLSICRSLIEMHKGRIGLLRSEVGVGSTFFFTLPLPEPEPQEVVKEDLTDAINIILCIDDDQQVISLYERFLRPQGYYVVGLTDAKLAVQRAKEIEPLAITLDIMMPERDGWQVMHELKNDPETSSIPIVICSILGEEAKGFSLGAADYLTKPFLSEDLVNAIHRINRDGTVHEVLVIDDDTADLRLVQKMVEESGHFHCFLAEGGKQGWERILSKRPDAIILDLFMPELDGFELLQKLRKEADLSTIPVIVLSGMDLNAEQHQRLSDFGQQMLTKGLLREHELLNTLEAMLAQKRSSPAR